MLDNSRWLCCRVTRRQHTPDMFTRGQAHEAHGSPMNHKAQRCSENWFQWVITLDNPNPKQTGTKKPPCQTTRGQKVQTKKSPLSGALDQRAGIIPLAALIRLTTSVTSNVGASSFWSLAIALSRSAWMRWIAVFGASASPSSSAFSALRMCD